MTPNTSISAADRASERTLAMRTLRAVALLVGACVLFVGALSLVAVAVTSRALGGGASDARSSESAPNAKKPLSI
jgi:uncharacterized membrane protein